MAAASRRPSPGCAARSASSGDETIEQVESEIVDGPDAAVTRMGGGRRSAAKRLDAAIRTERRWLQTALGRIAVARSAAELYLRVFFTSKLKPRKQLVTARASQKSRSSRDCLHDEQIASAAAARAPQGHRLPRPHGGAHHHRGRGDLALPGGEGPARPARLRRPDRQDARRCWPSDRAAWVHYKLDQGIDHVLIDEAQDTSPKQWEIIRLLTGEFFAGAGARQVRRTIFAVGDEKQSIFSFQGAAPREFDEMRRDVHDAVRGRRARIALCPIPPLVPLGRERARRGRHRVRDGRRRCAGCQPTTCRPVHESLPDAAPGVVEIWDAHQARAEARDRGLGCAVRRTDGERARRSGWREDRANTSGAGQAQGTRAGDVLVLVRQRGPLFEAIIRALKDAGVAVAGADRLVLTEHIAVMDLMVLADALLLAGGRSRARDRAEEPAVRARRRRSVRARLAAQGIAARGTARTGRRDRAVRGGGRQARPLRRMGAARYAVRVLCARARDRSAAADSSSCAARSRGRRRARRISQSRARLRAPRDAVAAGLHRLAAHRAGPT